ncbi:polysaccharide pyruvyl transferase family protein [Klebsiella quasipneumoniae]|uniref:polysaccharide pyruvyl transferase family protein n=1 Tax=Klebsiella pneumoniae complex TaxID=3390273 RepID=UPI000E2D2DDE|nr:MULTISPECIES: polysaccharide pyruvyl transferase family protein [Klebsiella]MCW9397725.1 polysaccharide pyruvyl transferase family protein [Klebsiella quasipneumoniae]SXN59526.1 polysaccharide pyruvyl transferase CsaB [Klebsiella pneumoniae]
MKVNLVGAVGGSNFGDEFILNCCIAEYLKNNETKVSVSGFSPNIVLKGESKVEHCSLNFFSILDTLRIKAATGEQILIDDLMSHFASPQGFDAIHFIGGGYINSLWPSNYALLAIAYVYSKIHKIPIYATGLGLYPNLENDNIISLFNSLDIIDVRDQNSKRFIPEASFTGDDALLALNESSILEKKESPPALILSLQSHLFEGQSLIEKIFTDETFNELKTKKIKKIIIIEAAPEDNIPFSREVFNSALANGIDIEFVTGHEILRCGIPFNSKSFVISSRYHVNLIYSMLKVNGIAVYQNEYYRNKHQSITDMGGKWSILSHDKLSEALDYWLPLNLEKKPSSSTMKKMAYDKKDLFSKIIANTQTKDKNSISLESALAIVNEFISK